MAMLPFIGYNVGDYLQHWLNMGKKLGAKAPKIFHVNWFRRDKTTNKFLWPGFGENLRAILWALERCESKAEATETPMGHVPTPEALNLSGLNLSPETVQAILEVNASDWTEDLTDQRAFFDKVGDRLPMELREEQKAFAQRLSR